MRKRRSATSWLADDCTIAPVTTTRGYTNQEQLDNLCLVDMNARVYDPTIGRFLSADPMTETVLNLQALNRYSYVGNNPLSYTDPSGMCFLGCFWGNGIFRGIAAVVIAVTGQYYLESLEGIDAAAEVSTGLQALNAGVHGLVGGIASLGRASGAGDECCAWCWARDLGREDPLRIFLVKGDTIWFAYCDPCERRLWLRLDNVKLAPRPKVARAT